MNDSKQQYVVEHQNSFLDLWPHRYDYIWAAHPDPGEKPQWQTETRHPLSDRLILQGAYLYGVRFGPWSQYVMLDIDRGSRYHPSRDQWAIARLRAALECLDLTDAVACTSSDSGGLHLYFPIAEAQGTWQLALAVSTVLENQGFKLAPGQLEIFPNPRRYVPNSQLTLYQAHRLPLQAGSYLLNDQLEPVHSSAERFVELWRRAQGRNTLSPHRVVQVLKTHHRRPYPVTSRAEKFLNDLNAEIERGWTGPGMTNRLLGRIAMRSYVFGHILHGVSPLKGQALVDDIVQTAKQLPGFYEWSNHVHDLEDRAQDWARSVEQSHYFPYGSSSQPAENSDPSHQDLQRQASRQKICGAIATLLEENGLPVQATARFQVLTQRFHIGGKTLYKYKDLWHPAHLLLSDLESQIEPLPDSDLEEPPVPESPVPAHIGRVGLERSGGAPRPTGSPSLLDPDRCNQPVGQGFGGLPAPDLQVLGCKPTDQPPKAIREELAVTQARLQQSRAESARQQAQRRVAQLATARAQLRQRMKDYLDSGDPVLRGEALNWLRDHPEPGAQSQHEGLSQLQ